MSTSYKKYYSLLCSLLFIQLAFAQYTIPDKPKKETRVYDYTELLSDSQKVTLESKLIKYSDSTSTQIVVIVIKSLKGENIAILAANWGHQWGIGQKKEDNGIVVLLAEDDQRVTIQTGYGIEHVLTDALSRRIIEAEIIPEFKKGDYYAGLDRGTSAIFEVLKGTYKNNQQRRSGIPTIVIIIIIFIILMIIFSNKKRKGGGNRGNHRRKDTVSDILETIILSRSGRGGFGGFGSGSGGGFGGGGFSGGFGGGGFGGGGASGGW